MKQFLKEIRWFIQALLFAVVLSFFFLFFYRLSFRDVEPPPVFTLRKFAAGVGVMLVCVYAVRWMVMSLKSQVISSKAQ
jgi:hypothetical protein